MGDQGAPVGRDQGLHVIGFEKLHRRRDLGIDLEYVVLPDNRLARIGDGGIDIESRQEKLDLRRGQELGIGDPARMLATGNPVALGQDQEKPIGTQELLERRQVFVSHRRLGDDQEILLAHLAEGAVSALHHPNAQALEDLGDAGMAKGGAGEGGRADAIGAGACPLGHEHEIERGGQQRDRGRDPDRQQPAGEDALGSHGVACAGMA